MNTTTTIETKKLVRPSREKIMSFTQEMIEALPCWTERDQLKAGDFAKQTYLKAKSSLVFICKNDMDGTCISYCHANPYNGNFSTQGYFCTVIKRQTLAGEMWVHSTTTPDDFSYLFEPEYTRGKWVVEQNSSFNQIGERVIIRAQIPSKNLWERIVEFEPKMMTGLLGGNAKGNAEHIVKCVNGYNELGEAFNEAKREIDIFKQREEKLRKLLLKFYKYETDKSWRMEKEKKADEASGGNVSYMDTMTHEAEQLLKLSNNK